MQPRLDGPDVPSEFLVDSLVALGHYFVGVLYAATAGDPCSAAPAALTPAVHAFAVEWYFGVLLIFLWEDDMLRF